jgi:nucleoside-diphosphate kinase
MTQKTFVMIKPDAVEQDLVGEILMRLESADLKLSAAKLIKITQEQAKELYKEHEGKEFYQGLIDFALSGPVMVTVFSGENAVSKVRELIGATDPKKAGPGTVRGDLAKHQDLPKNMVHASDSPESAQREIPIFFSETDILF